MNNLELTTQERLKKLAYRRSIPFCYSCYQDAPSGRCEKCWSDDLMRHLPGDGCEYGIDWVVQAIVREGLTPVDVDEAFEQSIRDCYPETVKVGWMELDTITVMKDSDPVSWRIAKDDWTSEQDSEGCMTSFDHGQNYYWTSEIESFLNDSDTESAEAS